MGTGLRILSGKDVVKILSSFGFSMHSQSGSHFKVKRKTAGVTETLIIPNHDPIAKGTLKAVFNQASKYVPQTELRKHFYNS
jgi:predicted RNA binding protein YcfA (HicA-like mRNA interferase family)